MLGDATAAAQKKIDAVMRTMRGGSEDASVQIGNSRMIDYFSSGSDSFSTIVVSRVERTDAGKVHSEVMASCSSFFTVKGKLLYLYANSVVKDNADVLWVKDQSKRWIAQLRTSNR